MSEGSGAPDAALDLAAGPGEGTATPVRTRPVATGTGPWPGTDALEAARAVLGDLSGDDGLPFLPELPDRGPGADPVGRATALLVDLPVDLQPVGWRLVDHPGRDAARTRALWSADTDALAEAADGWSGPLKLQVVGPWTLAASVWLPRGERAVVDAGATRDLVGSLAEGVAAHVQHVRRLVPGAQVVLQVDEPSLPAVLAGRLPTASGWGRLPAVDPLLARDALREVLQAAGCPGVLRCSGRGAPLGLLREAGPQGLATDLPGLGPAGWESVATAVEAGLEPWLGVLDPAAAAGSPAGLPAAGALVDAVRGPWRAVGLEAEGLAAAVLTPTSGLAGLAPEAARAVLRRLREAADALADVAAGG